MKHVSLRFNPAFVTEDEVGALVMSIDRTISPQLTEPQLKGVAQAAVDQLEAAMTSYALLLGVIKGDVKIASFDSDTREFTFERIETEGNKS